MQRIDNYMTIQEVASRLGVCEMTVRRWITAGKLKAIKIMGTVRISDSEFNRIKKGK